MRRPASDVPAGDRPLATERARGRRLVRLNPAVSPRPAARRAGRLHGGGRPDRQLHGLHHALGHPAGPRTLRGDGRRPLWGAHVELRAHVDRADGSPEPRRRQRPRAPAARAASGRHVHACGPDGRDHAARRPAPRRWAGPLHLQRGDGGLHGGHLGDHPLRATGGAHRLLERLREQGGEGGRHAAHLGDLDPATTPSASPRWSWSLSSDGRAPGSSPWRSRWRPSP